MYAQLQQVDSITQTSFTCTTFLPSTSAIGSSFVVSSYSGNGEFSQATGNWYTLLAEERVPVQSFNDQGNWFWDGTSSSQTYADDSLTLNCSAYRLLNGTDTTLQLEEDTRVIFGYKLFESHQSDTVLEAANSSTLLVYKFYDHAVHLTLTLSAVVAGAIVI